MKLSAAAAARTAGVDVDHPGVLQVGKIHADLAYVLVRTPGVAWPIHEVILVKITDHAGRATKRSHKAYGGGHGLRRARGEIAKLRRGEVTVSEGT